MSSPPDRTSAVLRPCPHCGGSHPAPWSHCPLSGQALRAESSIGRTLVARYRILGVLGEGGMGTVFRAEHLTTGRKVALKQLRPEQTFDPNALERFQREARTASATGHENVVELLDVGFDDDGIPFIVMELLAGVTLAEHLSQQGRLPAGECVEIASQILSGLEAVHAQKVVHRDLKPGNIFLTANGVKILDFGISKFDVGGPSEEPAITRTGATMGTPFYMSPEQARGARVVDHRADLYAVGVILYQALSGERPYESDNYHALLRRIISGDAPPLSRTLNGSQGVCDATHRAMQVDPRLRFQSAAQMSQALSRFRPFSVPPTWSRLRVSTLPNAAPAAEPKGVPETDVRAVATNPMVGREAGPRSYSPEPAALGAREQSPEYSSPPLDTGPDTAKVKGRLVLAVERHSAALKRALAPLNVQLPLSWVSQEALERTLVVVNFDTLRAAGASAAESLMENLAWASAPGGRVLGRLPALHRAFFSGNDIVVEGTDLCFTGALLGPRLSEVMAGFYEYALARAEAPATLTIRADRLCVCLQE